MLQSGYAADFILGLAVESLNGVRNRSTAGGAVRAADPDFIRALDLLREVQTAGAFGMRVEEDKVKGSTGVVFFRRDDVVPDIAEKGAGIRRLLKLPAEPQSFVLTYSPARGADNELAVSSRSMLQIMQAFASYLDVPEAHLKDHSAWPSPENAPEAEGGRQHPRIHSGKEKPAAAFAAVRYRDRRNSRLKQHQMICCREDKPPLARPHSLFRVHRAGAGASGHRGRDTLGNCGHHREGPCLPVLVAVPLRPVPSTDDPPGAGAGENAGKDP